MSPIIVYSIFHLAVRQRQTGHHRICRMLICLACFLASLFQGDKIAIKGYMKVRIYLHLKNIWKPLNVVKLLPIQSKPGPAIARINLVQSRRLLPLPSCKRVDRGAVHHVQQQPATAKQHAIHTDWRCRNRAFGIRGDVGNATIDSIIFSTMHITEFRFKPLPCIGISCRY